MLTKLEEQVLMAVWRLNGEGYGVSVFEFLKDVNQSRVTMGVVYDVLERMNRNGWVETSIGTPTPKRGGMRKKHYRITRAGVEELVRAKTAHDRLMDGFWELVHEHRQGNGDSR